MSELSPQPASVARPAMPARLPLRARLGAAWRVLAGGSVDVHGAATAHSASAPLYTPDAGSKTAELHLANERYSTLVASITDGLAILDKNWTCTFFSEQGAAIIGVRSADIVGRNIWGLFPEAVGTKFYNDFHRAMETGEVVHVEDYYPEPQNKWLECHCYPSAEGVSVFFRDISNRKRVEADLAAAQRESDRQRRLYEAVLSNTPDLAYIFGLDGRIIYANEVLLKMWGKSAQEAIGERLINLGYEAWHAEMHEREIAQVERTRQPVRGQVHFNGAFGRRLYDYILVPVLNAAGEVEAVAGTTRDVTDAEQAAAELRLERERLEFALQAAELGQWSLNFSDLTAERTLRHDQIFGYAELQPEWHHERFRSHVVPADRPDIDARVAAAMRGNTNFEFECRIKRVDGVERWIWSKARIQRDENGKPAQMLGLVADITDRKRAQLDLQTGIERLRLATEAAELGIWEWDVDADEVIWVNDRPYEIFGLEPGSAPVNAARFRSEFLCEGEAERMDAAVSAALASGDKLYFRGRMCRAGGEVRWFEMTGRIVPGASDGRVRMHGTFEDVTGDVVAAEQAQRAAEADAKLRTMFEQGTQFSGILSVDGRVIEANRLAVESCGLRREDVIGTPFWECGWWSRSPAVVETVREATRNAAKGLPFRGESPYFMADGSERYVDLTITPVMDDVGRVMFIAPTGTDITERKRAEQALRESEERFRLMADAAPVLIWVSGEDKRATWFNRTWLEFVGRPMHDELGHGWMHNVHPDDKVVCTRIYADAFDRREPFTMDYRMRRHDGEYRWILDTGVPRYDEGGRFAGYIGSCMDVTERRKAEDELLRHRHELVERVEQRTRELMAAHEQLRMSERMASLGTLSAGLGHDMGNLLVPIRVRLSLLEDAELGPSAREDLASIRTCVDYLQNLASGLRLLSLDPTRAPKGSSTDFAQWWAEAEGVMRSVLPRGVAVRASFAEEPQRMKISPAALTQVVFNLVQNAGDAMRERASGTVTVRGWFEGPHALLSVSDDGPGMTDEVKAHCMEPFFSTKPRGISTGLGLALVHGLVRDAGGTVELQTAPGQGAHFTLRLAAVQPSVALGEPGDNLAVVDVRDARVGAFVSAELRSRHYQVIHAPEVGAAHPPKVVVVDEEAKALVAPEGASVLLLGEAAPGLPPSVRSVGQQPKASAIRDALRAMLDDRKASADGAPAGPDENGVAAAREDHA